MLIVVSPAKSLDFESKLPTRKHSEPTMLDRSTELVSIMAEKSPDEIGKMMSISPQLAELNFERFHDWEPPFTRKNARPAIFAFNGDTYIGLNAAATFDERDYTHAQKVIRILSGLYGVLRPLDLIQPYRLEMGSKVEHPGGKDLYSFWGNQLTEQLNADLAVSPGASVLVNLASAEYFGSVRTDQIDGRVVTPRFLDENANGEYNMVGFFAKRARGAMAGWVTRNRVKTAKELLDFDVAGYEYSPMRSTGDVPVFTRSRAAA
jgi:cytoplasmic iron level regulating protein YaaA (DUF328/UPF0246 family)